MKLVVRWLVHSLPLVLLFYAIVVEWNLVMYILTGLNAVTTLLWQSPMYDKTIKLKLMNGEAFVIDWIPILVVVPFIESAAAYKELWGIVGINALYWIAALRAMRKYADWKNTLNEDE